VLLPFTVTVSTILSQLGIVGFSKVRVRDWVKSFNVMMWSKIPSWIHDV